ncbi:MAG: hypothetical protein V3W04_09500 [Gammaproteobacteria bacterium]
MASAEIHDNEALPGESEHDSNNAASTSPALRELQREVGAIHLKNPRAQAVLKRAIERLLRVDWDHMQKQEVASLLQSNDTDLMLKLARRIGHNTVFGASPREQLRLEGIQRFRALIEKAGGTQTMKAVLARLGIASDDTIRKRVKSKKMLAIPVGNRQEYPVWQFDGAQLVAHFDEVLQLLNTEHYIDQTRFFLTPSVDLDNLSPIDALKKDKQYLERIKLKARQFQHPGPK